MTDKQIMIDGVDVSGCEYVCNAAFGNIGCKLPFNEEIHCCNNPNCHYKQLQRKKQECEELISEKDFYLQKIETLENKCEELKEENEELSKRNNFLLQRLEVDDTETSLVFKLQKELENSKGEFYCAIKSELKYKKTLEEIEKYCNNKFYDKFGEITELINKKSILDIIKNQQLDGSMTEADRYRKALEEIEEYIKEEEWSLLDYVIRDINNIISKAKGDKKWD